MNYLFMKLFFLLLGYVIIINFSKDGFHKRLKCLYKLVPKNKQTYTHTITKVAHIQLASNKDYIYAVAID